MSKAFSDDECLALAKQITQYWLLNPEITKELHEFEKRYRANGGLTIPDLNDIQLKILNIIRKSILKP
jgi:hypothetical protein